tara:strand:+ start:582 stop:1340 length:759 start_codon:yes stop_codon:yes gene_type:complete
MCGQNKVICIAGKNQCAIDALKYVVKRFKKKYKILALPNINDNGVNSWQKSFKKYCTKNKIKITKLKNLYKIKNLYFFSLEFESILKVNKFKSKNLFNIHFSVLPKYRGCHTNYFQILNGERVSGVTLHIIDKGIDTGSIIDVAKFMINKNDTAFDNYLKLLNKSSYLFKKNIKKILENKFKLKKQNLIKGSYYSRKSVNYKKLTNIKKLKHNIKTHNKIRSLIFPPFQLPIYNGKKIKKSIYRNKKIYLIT